MVGDRWRATSSVPLILWRPKSGAVARKARSPGSCRIGRSLPTAHLLSLPTAGGGGRREWRIWWRGPRRLLSSKATLVGWVMTPCALDSLRSPPPASRSFLCPTTTPKAPLPAYTALGAEPTATHPHSDHRDRAAQASGSTPPHVLHLPVACWTPGSLGPCLASLGSGRAELPPRAGAQGLRSSLLPRPLAKAAETVEGGTRAAIPLVTPLWRGDTVLRFCEVRKKGPGICHTSCMSPSP